MKTTNKQLETTKEVEVTRETIFPSCLIKENPVRVKDMSKGYIKNALRKMNERYLNNPIQLDKQGRIDAAFKPVLEAEYRIKFLQGAIIHTP